MADKMESYVNCPACGELIRMELEQYSDSMMAQLVSLGKQAGLFNNEEKTASYGCHTDCKCGKTVMMTINVTAL